MGNAGKSLFIFGIYDSILAIALILVPNLLLTLFAVPPTSEPRIRVVGMLQLLLGTCYLQSDQNTVRRLNRDSRRKPHKEQT